MNEYPSRQFKTNFGTVLYRLDDGKWWDAPVAEDANDVAFDSDRYGRPLDFDMTPLAGEFLRKRPTRRPARRPGRLWGWRSPTRKTKT